MFDELITYEKKIKLIYSLIMVIELSVVQFDVNINHSSTFVNVK